MSINQKEIDELNESQKIGHPLTCCTDNTKTCKRFLSNEARRNGVDVPYTDNNEGVLIATENGWVCPCGDYRQEFNQGLNALKKSLANTQPNDHPLRHENNAPEKNN